MVYNPSFFVKHEDISLSQDTLSLLEESSKVYANNFDGKTWYGRCIFISWWCATPTCKFCYRSTAKHQKLHGRQEARRSMGSILLEALFCKVFNWRIEFLTGGCNCLPNTDIIDIAKNVSAVYGEKIWVNLGVIPNELRDNMKPYVKGICSSIETPVEDIHNDMCPQKPIAPYVKMFTESPDYKKSAALIVGLGDTEENFSDWVDFITAQKLDRITVYALKPIRSGPIEDGPTTEQYIRWLAKLRIAFPTLEIIGGTNLRRSEEVGYMMRAGVNAVTKFPATKEFGTDKARKIVELIESEGRRFTSNLLDSSGIDWDAEIDLLVISDEYKDEMRKTLPLYLKNLE